MVKTAKPSVEVITPIDSDFVYKLIERVGRICYKSEHKITPDSATKFLKMILKNGHESVIEHFNITVLIKCNRGVTHELVRHRLASYSQESTRYCLYSSDRFGNQITVIKPCYFEEFSELYLEWEEAMADAEKHYNNLVKLGATAQEARGVLPIALKTEIAITANLREWRHIFKLRRSEKAHPEIKHVMDMIYNEFSKTLKEVFNE